MRKGLSFRKQPMEARSWRSDQVTDIKLDGKVIGYISPPNWEKSFWIARFSVIKKDMNEDKNPNCDWKWIRLTKEFKTEPEAREAVRISISELVRKYKFHYTE